MSRDVWQLGGTGSCSGGTVLIFLSGGRSSEHRAFTLSSASPDARVEQRVPPGREVRLGSWQPACLPADYCEVRSVDSDGRDASCWTPVTLSSRGSRLWTWTKVSEGVALCCNFRTTGCPSWWRLFKLRSTGCLCDKWIKRGCSGLHWDWRTHHGKLPVFPLQPSEALRADGRGERDLWVSPDSHLKDGSYSQIFSSPIFTHMFGLRIRDCFIASAALH